MKCNQHEGTCNKCPFSSKCEPGALGGSPIETFIGQSWGPFFLPCHQAKDYEGNDTPLNDEHAQCPGAAVFRANIGRGHLMPDPLLKLPEFSDPDVFHTMEDFIRHHRPDLHPSVVVGYAANAEAFMKKEMLRLHVGQIKTAEQARKEFDT